MIGAMLYKKRSAIALSLFLFIQTVWMPIALAQSQTAPFKTFTDLCLQRENLPAITQHTITVLLQHAQTSSCLQANQTLSRLTELELNDRHLVDLSPLRSLTRLTVLKLDQNQIVDLSPLSELTNLTALHLSENRVSDLSPLRSLTKLTRLFLIKNRATAAKRDKETLSRQNTVLRVEKPLRRARGQVSFPHH